MKISKKRLSVLPGAVLTATFGFGLLAAFMPAAASASTAANAVIRNVATVNYADAGGVAMTPIDSAAVDVTVNLVAAQPTLSAPPDGVTPSNVAEDYTYYIVNNANGPDRYDLTAADNLPQAGITSQTQVFRDAADAGNITFIDLGATTGAATAAIGTAAITVPNDGANDGVLNGIVADDWVIIDGNPYQVLSVTDNATGTSTLTLKSNLTTAVSVGEQIGERGTFISRTTPVATVNNSTYVITVTANDGTSGAVNDDTTTTVLVAGLTVTKYVQNVSASVVCPGAPATKVTLDTGLGAGSIDYCSAGVNGNPGQTLEYVIAVANAAGGSSATNVVISDPVPAFTTQTGNIALDPGTGTFSNVATTANNDDFAELVGTTVFIYAGSGGDDNPDTGGSLAAGVTTYGAFRVNIDN